MDASDSFSYFGAFFDDFFSTGGVSEGAGVADGAGVVDGAD